MKIKKYTNGAWTDSDKPVKKFATYTDEATTLPLTIETSATDAVENYQVYGASSGVGEETENLIVDIISGVNITPNGVIAPTAADAFECCIAPIENGKSYGLMTSLTENSTVYAFFDTYPTTNGRSYDGQRYVVSGARTVVIAPITGYLVIRGQEDYGTEMVIEGSTAPTSYIPFGYKIPILCQSGNLFTEEGSGLVQATKSGAMRFGKSLGKLPAGDYNLSYVRSGQDNLFVTFKGNGGTYRSSEDNPTAFTVLSTDDEVIIRTSYASDDKTWAELGFTDIAVNQQSNYDLFLGDSKLYEDEYLDFVEQKVYRYVDGVLTPQDPPTPFPTLTTYIGENNLSVDTTVQPEKVAVEYEGWKGVGDVEKYHNGEWSDNNGT